MALLQSLCMKFGIRVPARRASDGASDLLLRFEPSGSYSRAIKGSLELPKGSRKKTHLTQQRLLESFRPSSLAKGSTEMVMFHQQTKVRGSIKRLRFVSQKPKIRLEYPKRFGS